MIIDAHQHIWDVDLAEYSWLTQDLAPIDRSILFPEFIPKMRSRSIDYTVLVQSADNQEDTQIMLEAASQHPEIIGIVAFLPLQEPTRTLEMVEEFAKNPKIVGVRNLIHTYLDPHWLLRPEVRESLDIISENGLTFDLVSTVAEHLEIVPTLSERHPNLKIVIDHLSKPPITQGINSSESSIWRSLMVEAAENSNVFAKISGLYPGVSPMDWSSATIRPFIFEAIRIFGSTRLMFGGDWPISVLSGDYEKVFDGLEEVISELPETDQRNIWAQTATNFYNLTIENGSK